MFSRAEKWCTHSGNGNWPDCDMLPIGPLRMDYNENDMTKFTKNEQKTMMTLWCMIRSPLIIGGEMTRFDEFTMSIVTNKELLEISKHSRSAHQLFRKGEQGKEQIGWFATHESQGYYIAFFNCDDKEAEISAQLPVSGTYKVYDIWDKKWTNNVSDEIIAKVPSHGAKVFHLINA